MKLAVLVPVLARPHRVAPLLDSLEATAPGERVLFITDSGDRVEHETINRERRTHPDLQVDMLVSGGTYPEKINRGVRVTDEPLLFLGADDLEFKPGWLEQAEGRAEVVGVNDLLPRRRDHATHFLVTREYAKGGLLHEGYQHWFCDDELIGRAKAANAYAYAPDAHVRHLHPMDGTTPDDAVYRKGRSHRRQDKRLFMQRRRQWT